MREGKLRSGRKFIKVVKEGRRKARAGCAVQTPLHIQLPILKPHTATPRATETPDATDTGV